MPMLAGQERTASWIAGDCRTLRCFDICRGFATGFLARLMEEQSDPKLQEVVFRIPRCYLVSYLETQSPSLAEPVIEAASPINEVLRALPKRQSVSAGDKRNCLAVSPELIDHSRREQSKTFAKSAPRKEEVAQIDRS